ncbi:granule-bound starch synthase 1, chloroplastic/amyloplastic-like isoform X2 [Apium graveolens]|uniref:granule-bound starch synthase 1, chloroplastic/amyloplastic-like isoform X2 n=1 Tax=Apium graveolens TaxID=4045 RepID=UPI003D7B429D
MEQNEQEANAKYKISSKSGENEVVAENESNCQICCLPVTFHMFKVWGNNGSKIDGPITGKDFQDNQLQFSLLFQAALEALRVLNLNNN